MEEIIKEQGKEGKAIYKTKDGKKIETYKEDVEWIAQVVLDPLWDFLNMEFEDNDGQTMVNITKALLERAEEKIYEATEYLEKNYGKIELERASYHQSIKPETILGIVFTPVEGLRQ
jgi:hypothetical protein